jgi:hypothetical protein
MLDADSVPSCCQELCRKTAKNCCSGNPVFWRFPTGSKILVNKLWEWEQLDLGFDVPLLGIIT